MLKWLLGSKTAKSRAPDKLDFDQLPVLSARALIDLTGQYSRLAHIRRIVQIDDATYQSLYQETLERFAVLVQLMPASQAHHHAVPGGMFVHTLEVLEFALTLRRQYKLPQFASEKQQEDERHLWTYAVFLAPSCTMSANASPSAVSFSMTSANWHRFPPTRQNSPDGTTASFSTTPNTTPYTNKSAWHSSDICYRRWPRTLSCRVCTSCNR